MSDKRVHDHINELLRQAIRAYNRGDINALRDIHNALLRMSDEEAAASVESKIRKLANSWAVVNR